MEGKLLSHKPLSALKVIGEGIELIKAPFQGCETLLREHQSYLSEAFSSNFSHDIEKPVRFIHIGQDHSRPHLKESNNFESKMSACVSQVAIYEKLKELRRKYPDMLVFHEQFMFREKSEAEFLLKLISGNPKLSKSSFDFEQSLLKKYKKFFKQEETQADLFDLLNSNLRSSLGGFLEQMAWQEWYNELLEIKRPEESGALYFFQGANHVQMRGRFRPTNTEDKSLLITQNLQILLESGFKLLGESLDQESFSSVLALLRASPWPASIQSLAKKTSTSISKMREDENLAEVLKFFKKQVLEEIHKKFVASFREEEALRQVNKYVSLERPSVVVFIYGLAHDIERQAEKHLSFPFSYEYVSTAPSETSVFLTPLDEISRKELTGRILTEHEAESKRRWEHIKPGCLLENKAALERAYFETLKREILR